MESLLKALLGGNKQTDGNPMMDILGSMLGGKSGQASEGMMGDLIGSLMGGGVQNSGGVSNLLEMVMGGGGNKESNQLVQVLVNNLGLSPAVAQMIVSYFTTKVVSSLAQLVAGRTGSAFESGQDQSGNSKILDLDFLLDSMGDAQKFSTNLNATGMPEELAQHAGIDQDTAFRGLRELIKTVAERVQTPQPVTTDEANLKGLLDKW